MKLKILYQDRNLVAVHKPSGMIVYADRAEDRGKSALDVLQDQLGKRAYPVHRLDRGTCGILIFALDSKAAAALQKSFLNHQLSKTYWAVLTGDPGEKGSVKAPLTPNKGKTPQPARTDFKRLNLSQSLVGLDEPEERSFALVQVNPLTGRYHQIRRHFKSLGTPLVGDDEYGDAFVNRSAKKRYRIERILLSAVGIELKHPVSQKTLKLRSEPDPSFIRALQALHLKT